MSSAVSTISNRAAQYDLAIVVTVDRGYLPYALFLLQQIDTAHPDRAFDFCILTADDMPPHPLLDALRVRVTRLADDRLSRDIPSGSRIPVATFLRLYAARAYANDYRRLLYLDADIFYRQGDLARLFQIDLGPHALAGARDPAQFRRRAGHVTKDMRGLGLGAFTYLSSGVQLIDVARYNLREIGEKAIALAVAKPDKMLVLDQTAINAVLQGDFAELHPGWNWLYGFRTVYYTEMFNPMLLHFAGRRKPWNHLNGEFPEMYSAAYRSFFAQHFPDLAAKMPPAGHPSQVRLRHLRFFFKHIDDLRRFVPAMAQYRDAYQARFPGR